MHAGTLIGWSYHLSKCGRALYLHWMPVVCICLHLIMFILKQDHNSDYEDEEEEGVKAHQTRYR